MEEKKKACDWAKGKNEKGGEILNGSESGGRRSSNEKMI